MKVFNGRSATDEYMSTHSLTFSTPEMTLKKFALWLGEQVNNPGEKGLVPRVILYIEDRGGDRAELDVAPDIDDTFKPSGAVTDMYGLEKQQQYPTEEMSPPKITPIQEAETKFCIECGSKIKASTKFCTNCGTRQT